MVSEFTLCLLKNRDTSQNYLQLKSFAINLTQSFSTHAKFVYNYAIMSTLNQIRSDKLKSEDW